MVRHTSEQKIMIMRKLMLVLVLCLPLMAIAGNGKSVKLSFTEWIKKNIVYPAQAVKNHEEGIVYVSFTISENGQAELVTIESGISPALDAEAILAVNTMPLKSMYIASEPNKNYILPIKFSLK